MSLPPSRRSTTLVAQALIFGRVTDGLTGAAPVAPPVVRLLDRDTGQDFGLPGRLLPDGRFVFFGQPAIAFPRLAAQAYRLRLSAGAPGYSPATLDFDVGPAPDQPALTTRAVPLDGIEPMRVPLFTGGGLPQRDIALMLQPNPVWLRGFVRVSNNREVGVAGARVSIQAAGLSATTDPHGAFTFVAPLPLVSSVNVKVEASGFETGMMIWELDYTRPVNTLSIGLKPS
jgi:hypothetical protein